MLISIVTINYNNHLGLEKTFESVLNQNFKNMEYIVVDGCSSDNSVEIIKKYEKKFNEKKIKFKWISEKDKGIYDALNKGILMSTGVFLNFLNSDDCLKPNILKDIEKELLTKPEVDFFYGDTDLVDENDIVLKETKPLKLEKLKKMLTVFCHQSLFINSKYHKKNLYSLDYKIVSDYNLFLKAYIDGVKFEYIPKKIVNFRHGGISSFNQRVKNREYKESALKNGINKYLIESIFLFREIKAIVKMIIRYEKYKNNK